MDLFTSPSANTTVTTTVTTTTTTTTQITSPSITTVEHQAILRSPTAAAVASSPTLSPTAAAVTSVRTAATSAPTTRNKNLCIFRSIDLKKKDSIDLHFKFINGRGKLKPPISYIGISDSNFNLCFQKIREWRKLTKSQQDIEIKKCRDLPDGQKKIHMKNMKTLMKNRAAILLLEEDPELDDSDDELEEVGGGNVETDEASGQVVPRISNRRMERLALDRARMYNDSVVEYVGLGSDEPTRKLAINNGGPTWVAFQTIGLCTSLSTSTHG
jgi:hypothetical protein